jgi:hypothetical protein
MAEAMEDCPMALLSEPIGPNARTLPALVAAAFVIVVVFAGPALNAWSASRNLSPDDPLVTRPIVDFWGVSLFAPDGLTARVSPERAEKSVRSAANGRLDRARATTVALMLASDREASSGLGLKDVTVYYVVTHQEIAATRRAAQPMPNGNSPAMADCATFAIVDATTAQVLGDLHFSCRW